MHWWAELWDNWAKMFGYDHWEWGSASDAFAAIGTVGALAVTLHIVRKDRRDRAQALARGVTGWWEADEGGVPIDEDDPSTIGRIATALTVTVRNSSAHPVTVLTASYLRRGTGGAYLSVAGTSGAYLSVGGDPSRKNTTLRPNEETTFKGYIDGPASNILNVLLGFYDNNGVHWTRNLETQEILPTTTSPFRRKFDYWKWMIRTGAGRWRG